LRHRLHHPDILQNQERRVKAANIVNANSDAMVNTARVMVIATVIVRVIVTGCQDVQHPAEVEHPTGTVTNKRGATTPLLLLSYYCSIFYPIPNLVSRLN
jgi:hypothetical protein